MDNSLESVKIKLEKLRLGGPEDRVRMEEKARAEEEILAGRPEARLTAPGDDKEDKHRDEEMKQAQMGPALKVWSYLLFANR